MNMSKIFALSGCVVVIGVLIGVLAKGLDKIGLPGALKMRINR